MFSTILIGVDGSQSGRDAIALARALGGADANLTLVHIYGGVPVPGRAASEAFAASVEAQAELLLQREREATGVDAELLALCAGSVGRGLHTAADQRGADLIVVGSHRGGLAGRVLVGDDTGAALNGAACAVAIAPHGFEPRSGGFLRIGVGYDRSPESHEALALARELAARDNATVRALRVVPIPVWATFTLMPPDWGEVLEQECESAAEEVSQLEGVEASAVHGVPVEELAAFGQRVDLLVVGSRSYGPLRRLVLGSTSSALARHARCPLLVLPRAAAPQPA